MDTARKAAYDALNEAIEQLVAGNSPEGHVVTDAVLIVGTQAISDEGHRIGATGVFLKDGCQPMWITRALINEAMDAIMQECTCDD